MATFVLVHGAWLGGARGLLPDEVHAARGDLALPFLGPGVEHQTGNFSGRRFRQPELAATLSRIASGGDREFYEGRTADLLVRQMQKGAPQGLIGKS